MNDDPQISLETRIAHLERLVDDLSDVVARQDKEIRALTGRLKILLEREAERELANPESVTLGNQKPPHW